MISSRLTAVLLVAGMFVLALPQSTIAQEDPNDTPLGDVARSFRKKTASSEVVIDNDNFSKVVEDAESRRAAGATMVFSLDPGGKNFQVSSRFGRTARSELLDEFGGNSFKYLRGQGKPIDALQFGDAGEETFKSRFARVGLQIGKAHGVAARGFGAFGLLGVRLFRGQQSVDLGLAGIAQSSVDPLVVASFEAVHCRADDSMEVVHRRRLEALCAAPVDGAVQSVAGLRIER